MKNKSPSDLPCMEGFYILDQDGNPIPEPDMHKWSNFLVEGDRFLKQDSLENGVLVSTVFLGFDYGHGFDRGPDRWKERSRFYPGIAKAMAEQWG